jgi:hypothetical protein
MSYQRLSALPPECPVLDRGWKGGRVDGRMELVFGVPSIQAGSLCYTGEVRLLASSTADLMS